MLIALMPIHWIYKDIAVRLCTIQAYSSIFTNFSINRMDNSSGQMDHMVLYRAVILNIGPFVYNNGIKELKEANYITEIDILTP